jgi:hypothetical protein
LRGKTKARREKTAPVYRGWNLYLLLLRFSARGFCPQSPSARLIAAEGRGRKDKLREIAAIHSGAARCMPSIAADKTKYVIFWAWALPSPAKTPSYC